MISSTFGQIIMSRMITDLSFKQPENLKNLGITSAAWSYSLKASTEAYKIYHMRKRGSSIINKTYWLGVFMKIVTETSQVF